MRHIKKKPEPQELQNYRRQTGAAYNSIDSLVKESILKSLLQEQKGVCAYCQLKITYKTATIEHHCERSICNGQNGTEDLTLDYKNLLAVCAGKGGKPQDTHCDTKKAEKAQNPIKNGLPMQVNPITKAQMNTIAYRTTGKVVSSIQSYQEEIDVLLNLNAPYLKVMRRKKQKIFWTNSKGNKQKLKKLLEVDLTIKDGFFRNNFPGLSEFMLKRYCH